MNLAPIVLFVYNRPWHAEQTLNALSKNNLADQSVLYIFSDGPKKGATAETLENIKKTRALIKQKQWCKEVFILERDVNYGLQRSIIEGVTDIVTKYGTVIVLEDDIITSKHFLSYMNEALNIYQDEPNVLSIGALNFFATDKNVSDTFFAPIPDCWGWATWENRWHLFEPNPQKLLNKLRENDLIDKFNLNGAYNFERMLIDQIKGNISSWAIRWQAVAYLENKLTLYPRYSVTKNIGFGPGGTHGGDDRYSKLIKFADKPVVIKKLAVKESQEITKKMWLGYKKVTQPTKFNKLKLALRKQIKHIAPPALSLLYRKIRPGYKRAVNVWEGNYSSWADAKQQSIAYEDPLILEKTKNAILKVKNGEAVFERDTILFDKPEYNWPVLTILLKSATENNNKLSVLDFGGSLGSVYFQSLPILQSVSKLEWSVIEQSHYVTTGNEFIADEHLKFYFDVGACLNDRKPKVLLLSSVLQYIEQPYTLITQLVTYNFDYIIIDRTAFIDGLTDRLTVQHVPKYIYSASYPAWFFSIDKFLNAFSPSYQILADFDPYSESLIPLEEKITGYYKSFIFKRT